MVNKSWKIIPRPLLETILNNHAQHHRVPQPLILHGPRGVGKTTLFLERLLDDWNKGPHITGYVDFAQSIKDHHPQHNNSYPWASWSTCDPPTLHNCKNQLETCLESMTQKGIKLGAITSSQIFSTLNKWHSLDTVLRRILLQNKSNIALKSRNSISKVSSSVLWDRAVFALSARSNAKEIDEILGLEEKGKSLSVEEASYFREAAVALRLAKETGGFSRSLANSCTDWPCLLLELLSKAAEIDYFQPKLHWVQMRDACPLCLRHLIATTHTRPTGTFGFPDIFISRENFGWAPQEAKMHMVTDYFSQSEWAVIVEVLGPNPRHLFELYALKQSSYYQKVLEDKASTFEDIVDAYLAYLQVTVVNPAMDRALELLQKFANDAKSGKIPKDRLRFGSPWKHSSKLDDPTQCQQWAKLQLLDFVQSLINTEFGVNYLGDCSFEIFDDPCTVALLEVGLLYAQRDPSFIRPISIAIQRCLVRWLVQERMKMSLQNLLQFMWQRIVRGRSYRHLMLQVGYK
ncbi:EMBRYO DEFECTIVE 1381 [Salix koriyanagi]|uniref:EMBRYO DEFECTIVE 1381 n=1 Tax=Salix koriyanagi TaxID=2511006 RepID=A0A9Q0TFL3_9ROSI|nr:EMBRYO DEFECTIVE 1381 [Salix koriyanagi]KAJ6710748.1 EMBRYO DEFECTIVE 1381 [Salix koriyanagi]